MILSAKLADNKIIVLNELNLTEVKTKAVVNVMRNVNAEGRTLLLLPERNETIFKSARNIDKMHISNVDVLNAYELLNNKQIVMTVDAVKKLEEVYA